MNINGYGSFKVSHFLSETTSSQSLPNSHCGTSSVVWNGSKHSGLGLNGGNPRIRCVFIFLSTSKVLFLLLIMGLRLKVAVFHGEDRVSGISTLCVAQGCQCT